MNDIYKQIATEERFRVLEVEEGILKFTYRANKKEKILYLKEEDINSQEDLRKYLQFHRIIANERKGT